MTRTTVRSLLILTVATGLFATGFAGCSKEEPQPQSVVKKTVPKAQAKAAEGPRPAETPAAKPVVVLYDPAGKRDPFMPFLKAAPKSIIALGDSTPPLQRFELGELKFVGVIWGGKKVFGLVEDREGKGYTVTVGTRIGRGGGIVTLITQGEILVKEEFTDLSGTRIARESSMKLQNAGGK
ncbi:MAG: pilus assembly protein PilP [Deltaproteobacteria bacterium]|nr:pilus assembly protein PilP [Deltaproteobacteria bacterium]